MARRRYYRRHYLYLTCAIVLLNLLVWGAYSRGWLHGLGRQIVSNQPGTYGTAYFVDGDTIAVDMNGQIEKVRFIGVDTPETHKPHTPVQCYGPDAAAFTKDRIGRQRVRLLSDPLSTDRDRYGRLLRYVYLPDGTDLDETLIQQGYGFYYPYFPFSKASQFAADEQLAMAAHRGLWGTCKPTPTDQGGYVSNPLGA